MSTEPPIPGYLKDPIWKYPKNGPILYARFTTGSEYSPVDSEHEYMCTQVYDIKKM